MTTQELREVVRNWVATAAEAAEIEDDDPPGLLDGVIENLVTMLDHRNFDPDEITELLDAYAECAVDLENPFDSTRELGRFVSRLAFLAPSTNVRVFRDGPERIFNRIIGKQP